MAIAKPEGRRMESELRKAIETTTDFPKDGVQFWDTTTIYRDPALFQSVIKAFSRFALDSGADNIVAIESKGFPLGGAVSYLTGLPLTLIRKPELTPVPTYSERFIKEYGKGEYHLKRDALNKGDKAYLLYDILAGSGATLASKKLIEQSGASLVGAGYIIELGYLGGREEVGDLPINSLLIVEEPEDEI